MAEVGRPTELTPEALSKIRELVLEGKNMKEVADVLEISYSTITKWAHFNYESFADKWLSYEQERKLLKAEKKIETLMESEDERVALQAATFIAETLGRKHYSKRSEVAGIIQVTHISQEEQELINKALNS